MDIHDIMKVLPHRYPFLLVDRILEIVPGERAVGMKNVTINEQFFQGHFPGHPVMPGVLLIEAMAQVAGILAFMTVSTLEELEKEAHNRVVYFMSIDKVKFRRPVVPGDTLRMEVIMGRNRGQVAGFSGKTFVEDALACEAEMKAFLVDREKAARRAAEGK